MAFFGNWRKIIFSIVLNNASSNDVLQTNLKSQLVL